MSQFYSQMSQFGDELEEDAIFGEFEAAWDAHSSASVVLPRRTNANSIPTHSNYTQAAQKWFMQKIQHARSILILT